MRHVTVKVNGQTYLVEVGDLYRNPVEVFIDGGRYLVEVEKSSGLTSLPTPRVHSGLKQELPGLRGITQTNPKMIRCPVPGRILSVSVVKGQLLEPGDEICVLESMKMEQSVRIAQTGSIKSIKIKENQSVNAGSILLELI
jgi:acetyl/propionyl-CoA carboxylase alpha subunit